MFKLANLQLSKWPIVAYSCPDKYHSNCNWDTDDSTSQPDEQITGNDADDEHSFDDGDHLFDNLLNISASIFHGMRLFDSVTNCLLANQRSSPSDHLFLPVSK